MDTYVRFNFEPVRADGVYLYDKNGNKVLDFAGGVAVNVLGYNNHAIEKAVIKQLHKGFFSQSNNFFNEDAENFAKSLCKSAGFFDEKTNIISGKAFFCNSGAEANETAIKIARKRYNSLCEREYNEVICMDNAFHGRTIATISATNRKKLTNGFEPLSTGFKQAKLNDINSVEKLITEHTCAVMLETIQGEGGIVACEQDFLKELRQLCNYHKIALILDEVQCGNGRTGRYFAYQNYDIIPDIITTAKGVAGGLPMGVCIAKSEFADFLTKGSHGATFGGNALCCSVAQAVLNYINDDIFLKNVQKMGDILISKLQQLKEEYNDIIENISGVGLMVGIKFFDYIESRKVAENMLFQGLSCAPASNNTLRFLPPLIITENHINEACEKLKTAIDSMKIIERY